MRKRNNLRAHLADDYFVTLTKIPLIYVSKLRGIFLFASLVLASLDTLVMVRGRSHYHPTDDNVGYA